MNKLYDIAISFQMDDILKVKEVANELKKYYSVFFAPENQEELVSNNQIDRFSEIFKFRAKFILLFFGDKYDNTVYTTYEKNLIQERCIKNNWYDLGVVMLSKSRKPDWYPAQFGYISYNHYSIEDCIDQINFKASAVGLKAEKLSPIEYARQMKEKQDNKEFIINYLKTEKAMTDAFHYTEDLANSLRDCIKTIDSFSIKEEVYSLNQNYSPSLQKFNYLGNHIQINWQAKSRNYLNDRILNVTIFNSQETCWSEDFDFKLDESRKKCWQGQNLKYYFNSELVETIVVKFIDFITDSGKKKSNFFVV